MSPHGIRVFRREPGVQFRSERTWGKSADSCHPPPPSPLVPWWALPGRPVVVDNPFPSGLGFGLQPENSWGGLNEESHVLCGRHGVSVLGGRAVRAGAEPDVAELRVL